MATTPGSWTPYLGADKALLAFALVAIAIVLAYLGTKMTGVVRAGRPGKVSAFFTVATWALSVVTLLFVYSVLRSVSQQHVQIPSPITPVTLLSALCTFIIIAYLTRSHGLKVALGSAFVGTAAAPMIFELPFDLIISPRVNGQLFLAVIFFLPLFLVEVSTMALVPLSPLAGVSKFTLFSLAGVFGVFAVWALFGFAYPADPASFTLNSVSKVFCFITAITLFANSNATR